MLERPAAMEVFNCSDLPANDVNVYFFATERPSIRIEYSDGVRAGWLVPSASGSKYETSSGGFFWQKGGDAVFAWNEGQQMDCTSTR
jgi:membrane-bound inhibitor of C-type lysozyme